LKLTECGQLHLVIRLCLTREVGNASAVHFIETFFAQPKRICVDDVCTAVL
jgi:hypothetical protein